MKNDSSEAEAVVSSGNGRFAFTRVLRRWWWLGLLVMIVLTGGAAKLPDWFGGRGPLYESTALLEVMPIRPLQDRDQVSFSESSTQRESSDRRTSGLRQSRFLNTQKELLKTRPVLWAALKKNDLLSLLGGDEEVALVHLEKILRVSLRRGTDLIEITCRDEDPQIAYTATVSICKAYEEIKKDRELKMRQAKLTAIKLELQKKNDRVAELRKRVMDLAEKTGLKYVETGAAGDANSKMEILGLADPKTEREKVRGIQEFNISRKEYQKGLNRKDSLELKYDLEKTKMIMPMTNLIIHEQSEKGRSPVTKGRHFYMGLLVVLSLPFSLLVAISMVYFAELVKPRRCRKCEV